MNALLKVGDQWKKIGLHLKIPKEKLEVIAEKNDPYTCLVDLLFTWLKQVDPPPTWTAIIEAVEFLGEEQLAKELREKYSGEHVNNAAVTYVISTHAKVDRIHFIF